MKLVEGIHYTLRLDQPSGSRTKAKQFVNCSFCVVPSDTEDEDRPHASLTLKQVRDGIRLDHLLAHIKKKHKGHMPSEGRSLLDLGFTLS